MLNKHEELPWENIFDCWKRLALIYEPNLLFPINVKQIHVVNYIKQEKGDYFYGYDWIHKSQYEKRIEQAVHHTTHSMLFGTCLNKGTLHTLETLNEAKDNTEDCAAIWLYAFTSDVLNSDILRGYSIVDVQYKSQKHIWEKYPMWHHAMRKLLPEICFSYEFLHDLNIDSYKKTIELAVISSAQILNNYIAVEYDSRERE